MSTSDDKSTKSSSNLNDVETASVGNDAEIGTLRQRRVSRNTLFMDDFFELNDIDKSTQEMFLEYDKNGDGSFTKNEVMCIISDLKKQFRANEDLTASNRLLKRMLFGAIVFFFLLVGSLFGVSVAVATLTKETTVKDGSLYIKDGSSVVATDSRAHTYDVDSFEFGDCLAASTLEAIKIHVQEGKNVILKRNNGTDHKMELLSPSGATYNDETGVSCFPLPESVDKVFCFFPDTGNCNNPSNRRRILTTCNRKGCDRTTTGCQCTVVQQCETVSTCRTWEEGGECIQSESFDGSFTCPTGSCNCDAAQMIYCYPQNTQVCRVVQDCSSCTSS